MKILSNIYGQRRPPINSGSHPAPDPDPDCVFGPDSPWRSLIDCRLSLHLLATSSTNYRSNLYENFAKFHRSPKVLCQRGSAHIDESVERSRHMLTSTMSWQSSDRYIGALPKRHWKTSTATLYLYGCLVLCYLILWPQNWINTTTILLLLYWLLTGSVRWNEATCTQVDFPGAASPLWDSWRPLGGHASDPVTGLLRHCGWIVVDVS